MFQIWNERVRARFSRVGSTRKEQKDQARRRNRPFLEMELLEPRITPSKLTLLPASLPVLVVGQKPQVSFTAINGDGHYKYRLASGRLPKGITLGTSGLLAGEPTVVGTYHFAIKVTDPTRGGKTATRSFSLTVHAPAAAVTTTTPPATSSPGLVTQFAITSPASATAGTSFYVSVTAKNSADTTMTGFSGSVTLTSSDGQDLNLTGPLVFYNGTAQAAVTLNTADALTLTATSGPISGTSGLIVNGVGALSTFAVHAPSTTTTGIAFPVTITAEDAFGNTLNDYEGGVSLTTSDGQSVDLAAAPVFHNGTAVISLALTKPDQVALTATGSGAVGSSNIITNNPPTVSTFVVSSPVAVTAGVPFPVTITAEDLFGDTVTGFDGDVAVTSVGGQAVSVQSHPVFSDGTAVATVCISAAGTSALTVTAANAQGTGGAITVNPGPLSSFRVSAPTSVLAGTGFFVTVTATDSFGNTVANFDGSATVAASDGQPVNLLSPVVFTNGTALVNIALASADTVTITATAGTIQNASGSIVVSPPPATQFVVAAPSSTTAGAGFAVSVIAEDDSGAVLTGFNGNVSLSSSDGQPVNFLTPLVFDDGVGTATITLDTADTLTLTAVSGNTTGTSGPITDNPGTAVRFAVSAPSVVTAGIGFAVTITAQDAFGNVVPGFSGATHITSSDGQSVVVLSSPIFSDGSATVNAALNSVDTVHLTAASGAISGVTGSIVVNARSTMNDWFSQNMPDPELQDLARSDYTRDGSLTYGDMLDLFAAAESEGAVSSAALQSLQALVTPSGAAAVNMAASVQSLAYKVVNSDPANAAYLGKPLGNLTIGSPAAQLQDLVDQWFLGENLPAIDTQNTAGETVSYVPPAGTLFGPSGPSYQDVFQGEEGDCWLLASFAETAAVEPSIIQSMFIDDGTTIENGVQVHVWTVRFYEDGVTSYLTVNNELPASNGNFVYAGGFQPVNAASNVLWVPLLEKAYAQLSASGWNGRTASDAYSSLDSGDASTALPVITGVPESPSFALGSQNSFASAVGAETLMTLASLSDGGGTTPNALGVVPDHDYAVLGYNASNQTFALLNPWGWNNSNAPGILNLSYTQITQNFYLDGNCSTVSSACLVATAAAS